jgi:hypothetical protein
VTGLVYLGPGLAASDIYVEKAPNILVAAFIGAAVVTALVSRL